MYSVQLCSGKAELLPPKAKIKAKKLGAGLSDWLLFGLVMLVKCV
jgi:hypothetical protein